jgi:hypothetical protein
MPATSVVEVIVVMLVLVAALRRKVIVWSCAHLTKNPGCSRWSRREQTLRDGRTI